MVSVRLTRLLGIGGQLRTGHGGQWMTVRSRWEGNRDGIRTGKYREDMRDGILEKLNDRLSGLPAVLGVKISNMVDTEFEATMKLNSNHLAANGFCHAGSIVTLADTTCGAGAFQTLPKNATNFTTLELKSNFLGTAVSGTLKCCAQQIHGGKSTQIWDATVFSEEGKKLAVFRCTQLVLYEKE